MSNNYSRGANFERQVRDLYRSEGWWVGRSAGSHSVVDLIAMRCGEICLIQCKTDGALSKAERAQIIDLAQENTCQAVLAYKSKGKIIREKLGG